jgi:hypothetical protein
MPRWVVLVGGVLLGLAIAVAYVLANMPPDADDLLRAGYERGFRAGAEAKQRERGREVRRTPPQPQPQPEPPPS